MPWQRRDKRWIAQVRQEGKKVQSLHLTKEQALTWESDRRRESAENWQTRSGSSLGDLANEYLKYSQVKHSKKTWEEKRDLFKRFFREVDPNTSYRWLRPDTVLLYLQTQAKYRSGYAANKSRKNLLAFSVWVSRFKRLEVSAFRLSEKFPEQRKGRYVPPEEDFWKVYDIAQGQDKTMLLAYLHLAARRSELFRLRWEDVDFGDRKIRLYTRKRKDGNYESDWLPLTGDLFSALVVHRDFVGGEYVFPNAGGGPYKVRQHVMAKLCTKAKVRKFDWHAIRHLSATLRAQNPKVSMIQISQILRHRNLGTTERYIGRLGDLREALEVLGRKER